MLAVAEGEGEKEKGRRGVLAAAEGEREKEKGSGVSKPKSVYLYFCGYWAFWVDE